MNPSLIIAAQWIATQNPVGQVLENHGIAIGSNGRILSVAPLDQLQQEFPETLIEHRPNHLLTPGLINLHSHVPMTLLRGVGDDLPMRQWLEERIWPLEAKLVSPEFCYDGALLAGVEMLLNGVTCFSDSYFHVDAIAAATLDLGMKAHLSTGIVEFPTPYAQSAADYIRRGLTIRDQFRGEQNLSFAFGPHAPYSVSDETFKQVITLSMELGLGVQTHLHETADEVAESIKRYGMRPIARMKALGLLDCPLIAAHCVHLNSTDIEMLATHEVHVAHCPTSNLKLASGIAPIPAVIAAGINFGFGTDGSASNNRLDLLREGNLGSLLAKGTSGKADLLDATMTLAGLTINAARAIGRDSQIGSIAVGKSADLVTWDLSGFEHQPVFDPIAQLLFTGAGVSAADVFVNGQSVVHKRQLVGSAQQRLLSTVTARLPMWHNRVGEILSAVA